MTLILDTNVVSEIMRPVVHEAVARWIETVDLADVAIATITLEEVRYGLRVMPEGARKAAHVDAFEAFAAALTLLPFDREAAECCAMIRAERRLAGRPVALADAQIAGIARAVGAVVATRDGGGFAGCGIDVVNPWRHGETL